MHLGVSALLDFYREHRAEESLVLATIIATEGSTYRKPGAMMLISRDGRFEGLISGGCLEADLLHHAAEVFATGRPGLVSYDMRAEDELVWNLGLGCDGLIRLLLQRLERTRGFDVLEQLSRSRSAHRPSLLGLVTGGPDLDAGGRFSMLDSSDISVGDEHLLEILRRYSSDWPAWRSREIVEKKAGDAWSLLLVHVPPPVRVLICGAGPDAVPVAQMLAGLDWEIHLTDYRPAFLDKKRFPPSCMLIESRPNDLSRNSRLNEYDAAVIMSHHLENDAAYLRQLAGQGLRYIGLLGPAARRRRLKEMTDCKDSRLHGPAGLDIGAELPQAIALSIAAEIHAVLNGRDGRSLLTMSGEN